MHVFQVQLQNFISWQ